MRQLTAEPPIRPFEFTPSQRERLTSLLSLRKGQTAEGYLKTVEAYIPWLREDYRHDGVFPAPLISEEIATLKGIEKRATDLFVELRASYSGQAQMVVRTLLERHWSATESLDIVENHLPFLIAAARRAQTIAPQAQRGHPQDHLERDFIATLGRDYVAFFGKKPTYSRNTSFPRFVAAVLEIALPGNPHAVSDNSKIIRAALVDAAVLPERGARSRRQRGASKRRR